MKSSLGFAVALLFLMAFAQAAQDVFTNPLMDGCTPGSSNPGTVTSWTTTGTAVQSLGINPSQFTNEAIADKCYASFTSGTLSQTVSLDSGTLYALVVTGACYPVGSCNIVMKAPGVGIYNLGTFAGGEPETFQVYRLFPVIINVAPITLTFSAELFDGATRLDVTRISLLAPGPPDATIAVDKTEISENPSDPATFEVTVFPAPSSPVTVNIAISGTATLSSDFTLASLSGSGPYSITVPVGQATATFTVTPVADQLKGGSAETVIATIQAGTGYDVGTPSSAKVTITENGKAFGDPHMIGFQGQRFDYIGERDQVINMLSDPDLQVNTLLGLQKQSANMFFSGPVMMQMAFMTRSHTISINAGGYLKEETAFVLIDGVLLPVGQSFLDGILSVTFTVLNASSSDFGLAGNEHLVGEVVVRLEAMYEFRVFMIENGRDPQNPDHWLVKYPRRFLDFNASLLDVDRRPHGVLGQTAAPLTKERSMEDWTIEGKDEDYVVKDGLTGTQFTFNKF